MKGLQQTIKRAVNPNPRIVKPVEVEQPKVVVEEVKTTIPEVIKEDIKIEEETLPEIKPIINKKSKKYYNPNE